MEEFAREIALSKDAAELHSALVFDSPEDARRKFASLAVLLAGVGARVVSVELFGPSKYSECAEIFKAEAGAAECPVMRVLPLDEESAPELAGAHVTSVRGVEPEFEKTASGSKAVHFECGGEEYCRTFGVCAPDSGGDAAEYTKLSISELSEALAACGFGFSDVARTWFYNRDILSWYDGFNRGRTEIFRKMGVFDGLLPASTGIGSPNPAGVRIQCGAFAVRGAPRAGRVYEIESPLQCGAPEYGSSFARAVEMELGGGRRIMVSGTASIDPVGNTVHFGDIDRQVSLTMRVIGAILESRGMSFKDTVRAVAYCMNPRYYAAFKKWMSENCEIPHVPSYSTVCRSDLMFEVELDAASNPRSRFAGGGAAK